MRVDGKVAIVTGGAAGLGAACALALHAAGAKVAIWDLSPEKGNEIVSSLGANAAFFHCNVADPASVNEAFRLTLERFQAVHILVNSAGIFRPETTVKKNEPHRLEKFEHVMKVNVYGTFYACRVVAGQMIKQQKDGEERGVIILISSIGGQDGIRGQVSYAASKGAIDGMTLPMARDLSLHSIRVVTIAPGPITTEMTAKASASISQTIDSAILVGRQGRASEFSHLVLSILQNGYLNGCVIRFDGGLRLPNL